MLKSDRVSFIQNKLNQLYPKTPTPLHHENHFQLLIAVLLSAQCTDAKVNKVTPILFNIADSASKMQSIEQEEVYNIIRPCGLAPKKSKAIIELSKILMKNYNGEVPPDMNLLEELPGVGHKTASVVVSQGFGIPAFPIDTHIHRLAQRWGLTNGKNVIQTEYDLKKIFPMTTWNRLHLQIIFYGRDFCTSRGCDGRKCEICRTCYPKRKKPFIHKKP
ncbi:MAG: endonuclease III [Rhodobacteraceae bacterium]|nr:MAG: endonuclease III [Paracoccaceae bacterium]